MQKSLIYLNEDLASSIALRFAAQTAKQTGMRLQTIHVEEPDGEVQAGTGWVRRTWEQGLVQAGRDAVHRLLKTEKISGPFAGEAKVLVGTPDKEILEELRRNGYALYIEGYLNTANTRDFYELLASDHLRETSHPVMVVKNLVPAESILLLVGEAVDATRLISDFTRLYTGTGERPDVDLTIIYYRFRESTELRFLAKNALGSELDGIEVSMAENGWLESEILVMEGTPEQAAQYVRDHGLVVSSFPTRNTPRAELLALASNPILLFKQAKKPGRE